MATLGVIKLLHKTTEEKKKSVIGKILIKIEKDSIKHITRTNKQNLHKKF